MSQDDLADKANVSRYTITQLESAKANLTLDTLENIVKALNCTSTIIIK